MTFADNLAALPAIDHLAAIEVLDADGNVIDTVENKPGKSGSVKVYNHLAAVYGALTPEAASAGLTIFAEHTEDARANPGKHPERGPPRAGARLRQSPRTSQRSVRVARLPAVRRH